MVLQGDGPHDAARTALRSTGEVDLTSADPSKRVYITVTGGGVSGLLIGRIPAERGIETLALERAGREEIETRPRAGLLGPAAVEALDLTGMDDGLRSRDAEHHSCEFRHRR